MLRDFFEKYEDEFLKFDRVSDKFSSRRDLHAFLLLDRLMPGNRPIVSAAEHDEIWLDVDCEELYEIATEAQILELIRCGIRYDDDVESLCMFA